MDAPSLQPTQNRSRVLNSCSTSANAAARSAACTVDRDAARRQPVSRFCREKDRRTTREDKADVAEKRRESWAR